MRYFDVDDIAAVRAEQGLRTIMRAFQSDARAVCDRNRLLVLAYDDLAQQLTKPPVRFGRPEQWSGYIAPEVYGGRHNDSPYRAQLVALVAEAEQRNTRKDAAA